MQAQGKPEDNDLIKYALSSVSDFIIDTPELGEHADLATWCAIQLADMGCSVALLEPDEKGPLHVIATAGNRQVGIYCQGAADEEVDLKMIAEAKSAHDLDLCAAQFIDTPAEDLEKHAESLEMLAIAASEVAFIKAGAILN